MNKRKTLIWHTEQRKLGELIEWDKNPRQLTNHDAEHLKKSIDNFGIADPLIINTDNRIVGGHMRRRIMLQNGYKPDDMIDVRVPDRTLTEREAEELAIRLNKNSGSWDFDALGNNFEFENLIDWGFSDEELTGLDFGDTEQTGDPVAQIDTNQTLKLSELMDLREKWDVNIGQVWRCGDHTVMCGDSTKQETFDTLFETIQRPEYLIYDPDWDSGLSIPEYEYQGIIAYSDGYRARDVIKMFGLPTWIFAWDGITSWYTPNRPLRRAKLAFWFGDIEQYNFDGAHYGDAGEEHEVKNSRGAYMFHPDPRGKHLSDIFQMSLPQLHSDGFHPYEKPLDWVRLLIGDCFSGNSVFDPFLGCGNTALACQQLGKSCVGIDIEPMYIAFLLEQFSKIGIQPVLEVNSVSDL